MFFLNSSVRTCLAFARPSVPSSRSFASDEILSKNDADLLYAGVVVRGMLSFLFGAVLAVPSASPTVSVVESSDPTTGGDPDAIASLIRSSLLNLAFADSKSKSDLGISIFFDGPPPRG